MTSCRRCLCRYWRYIFRRNGHGVHSPFVFRLITQVIQERTPYYCFSSLWQENKSVAKPYRKKDLEFLFRLVAYYGIRDAVVVLRDDPQKNAAINYLKQAGVKPAAPNTHFDINRRILLLLESHRAWEEIPAACRQELIGRLPSGSMIIVTGDLFTDNTWAELVKSERVTVSVDMLYMGLCVVNAKLNKRLYKVFH